MEHKSLLLDPEEARGLLDKSAENGAQESAASKTKSSRPTAAQSNLYAQAMAEDAEQPWASLLSGDVQFRAVFQQHHLLR